MLESFDQILKIAINFKAKFNKFLIISKFFYLTDILGLPFLQEMFFQEGKNVFIEQTLLEFFYVLQLFYSSPFRK